MTGFRALWLALGCLALALSHSARAEPSVDEICRTLAQSAAVNDLPEELFTRLIWQESRFDPMAVSPAGARGIAQFMPQTAAARGLIDAFEPLDSLRESASYLRELRTNPQPGQLRPRLAPLFASLDETLQAHLARLDSGRPSAATARR